MHENEPKPLVLLIDDDHSMLEVTRLGLEARGFAVATATDGRHALRMAHIVQPDAIVCDMMMPVMDGFGFLHEYARQPPPHAPIVVASAFSSYLAEAGVQGAAAGLVKPFDMSELADVLRDVIAGRARRPGASPTSAHKSERLRHVLTLEPSRAGPERDLQELTLRVAIQFDASSCLLTVVNSDGELWTAATRPPKTRDGRQARADAVCTHALVARAALVVQDTPASPFFKNNPAVSDSGLRFYAGVPLIDRHGTPLGSLCILDARPRPFGRFDLELLALFGRRVLEVVERHELQRHPERAPAGLPHLGFFDDELGVFGRDAFLDVAQVETARLAEHERSAVLVVLEPAAARLGAISRVLAEDRRVRAVGRLGPTRLAAVAEGLGTSAAERFAEQLGGPASRAAAVDLARYPAAARVALREAEALLTSDAAGTLHEVPAE